MLAERKERIAVIVVESESHESLESRDSMWKESKEKTGKDTDPLKRDSYWLLPYVYLLLRLQSCIPAESKCLCHGSQ